MYDTDYNASFFLKVEDIESKLDLLIDLYKEDRKPLLQHCQDCSQQNNMPVEHNQMEVTSCLKNPIIPKPTTPRSILFDKHCILVQQMHEFPIKKCKEIYQTSVNESKSV